MQPDPSPAAAKERPILFSAPMVLAILAGRKTVTRRVVKPQPQLDTSTWWPDGGAGPKWMATGPSEATGGTRQTWGWAPCPYGMPGERLWVREAWTKVPAKAYGMSEGVHQTVNPADRADAAIYAAGWDRSIPKWKPSIHMPRWASRILLEITDVKVERLQDITEAEAIAEGSQEPALAQVIGPAWSERGAYAKLWDHINGPDAWAANPWVWAVSFRRIEA